MFIKLLTLLFFHQNNILSFKKFYLDGELLLLFLSFYLLTLNIWTRITVGCLIEGGCNSWGWGDLISKSDKRAVFLWLGARFFKIQNKIKFGNLVKITQTKTILLYIKGKLSIIILESKCCKKMQYVFFVNTLVKQTIQKKVSL